MKLTPGQADRLSNELDPVTRAVNRRNRNSIDMIESRPKKKSPIWYNPNWRFVFPFYALSIAILLLGILLSLVGYHQIDDEYALPGLIVGAVGLALLVCAILLDRYTLKYSQTDQEDYETEDSDVQP